MFVVPGDPRGKERPRFNYLTKTTYTPEKTKQYEDAVRYAFRTSKDFYKIEGPIKAYITAYYKIPKKTSKKTKEAMINKEILPTCKPDADNVLKSILDALNKVAYEDDSQVVEIHFNKFYSEDPRVEISLERCNYV